MSDLQAPIINFQVRAAKSKSGFTGQRALLIAKVDYDAGTANATLVPDIQEGSAKAALGALSIAYKAYVRFRKYNKSTPIDVFTLKDTAASSATKPATGSLTVTGTASLEDISLRIALGDDGYIIDVPILKGDNSEAVAAKITAVTTTLMTGEVDSANKSIIKYTYTAKGTFGNGTTIRVLVGALGLTFTPNPFSNGADAIVASDEFTKLPTRYQTVIFDNAVSASVVYNWLDARFNTANGATGGVAITSDTGGLAALKTKYGAINSKTLVVMANATEMQYTAVNLLLAAEVAAKRALRLTEGAILGDLVIDAGESFGGQEKASLPYHNTPMSYEKPAREIGLEQLELANAVGLSFIVPSTINTVLGSIRTLYKTNNSGIADGTFAFLNAVDTSLAIQEYLYNNCQKEYGQTRATHGDLVQGVSMTNVLSVKSYIVGLYEDLVDLALVQGGADAVKAFKRGLTVTLDSATGFYSVYAPVAIVSQFRGLNGVIAISYDFQ